MNEKEAREYVKNLKKFYTEAVGFGGVVLLFILIWAASGMGYFWPLWVILFGGMGLLYRAINFGFLPQLTEMLPFTNPQWEDDQVKKLTTPASSSKAKKGKAVAKTEDYDESEGA
ncbi:2TM domain-containing protein [Candidatus Bealeia paramacronuclearis]|uniref:2TM domain-containing protein n=1 Tax=Candidatus Bealeia paramacronuclearis TaxID=1921001 RepID=A0ABZ2C3K8_9PROT|nr:2TM domain-containing protein [Candidatus Bealeia paramacronuclearis]